MGIKFNQTIKGILENISTTQGTAPQTTTTDFAARRKRLDELSSRKAYARMSGLPEGDVYKTAFEFLKKQAQARGEELNATPLTPEEETELQTMLQQKDTFETRPRPSNADTGASQEYANDEKFRSQERNI